MLMTWQNRLLSGDVHELFVQNSEGDVAKSRAGICARILFLHPHPLTLVEPNHDFSCFACHSKQRDGLVFRCDKCDFNLDLKCAFISTWPSSIEKGHEKLRTVSNHEHPLVLFINVPKDCIQCSFCGIYCSVPTYACFPCHVFMHPGCYDPNLLFKHFYQNVLPQEICHPFHPYHPLTLRQQYHPGDHKFQRFRCCNACLNDTNVAYICESDNNCSFRLHVECSGTGAGIQYEGHSHILRFKDNENQIQCSVCNSTCDSYHFSCLDPSCRFNLHQTCGPLPYTIKHKCHIHPLILTSSLATYEDYQKDDEFYCDACEKERDPLLPIYQCIECQFAAEFQCVNSEVIPSLKGECGDIELRSPLGHLGRVITKDAAKEMVQKKEEQRKPALTAFFDIFKSMSKDEKKELSSVGKAIEREIANAEEILSQEDDEVLQFSDKAYTKFIKFLDDHSIDNIPIYEYDHGRRVLDLSPDQDYQLSPFLPHFFSTEGTVNVGDYVVTQKFAPILNHLLSTHGDISAESMLSPRVKAFLFDMLCVCIYRMKNMKVVDITHDLLVNWSTILKTLQRARFRIQFAIDHLKRLSRAHYGLHLRVQVDNAIEKIDTDIDRLKKDLEALKVKRELITSAETKKSGIVTKAMESGWTAINITT